MSTMIPIFVIGAMKCGTTTIYKNLSLHKLIATPKKKETSYFCDNMGKAEFKKNDFFNLYSFNANHKYFYDGSTNYTKYPSEPNVAKKIFEYGLNPKFIYIVRDPFDRIESHYNYSANHLSWKQNEITSAYLIDVSNYYKQLNQYKKFFNTQEFLIVDFDSLKNNQQQTIQQIYDFIGIKDYIFSELKEYNKAVVVNRNELKLRRSIDKYLYFFPYRVKKKFKNVISPLFKKTKRKLTSAERKYIHLQLKSDMLKLRDEYGINVKKWGFE